ncbi:uncharacterized protein LOC143883557 [Tasmannia lanceolata]|uniref:uncharacterized protein LOC143883557 n=1 Tax=Tasmannia lanceolata TaxID=3420 RepID=UPI004063F9CF
MAKLLEEFQPSSDWIREDGSDTLLIYLPGFRRDQCKAQIDNLGNLWVSGERPLDGNNWSRFRSNFRISNNCHVNEITAKFANGTLSITMPKKIPQVTSLTQPTPNQKSPTHEAQKEPKFKGKVLDQKEGTTQKISGKAKDQSNGSIEAREVSTNGLAKEKQEKSSEFVDARKKARETTEQVEGDEFDHAWNTAEWNKHLDKWANHPDPYILEGDNDHGKYGPRRLIVNVLAVAIVVVVALGIYATIKLRYGGRGEK